MGTIWFINQLITGGPILYHQSTYSYMECEIPTSGMAEKILISWDAYSPYMGKNVPNHQPVSTIIKLYHSTPLSADPGRRKGERARE